MKCRWKAKCWDMQEQWYLVVVMLMITIVKVAPNIFDLKGFVKTKQVDCAGIQ